ncbi:MAG: hypothetical protein LBP24_03590 [Coriobacteriales bacterium]|jgi:hypothetical protein|nr:hypothetical protein [Coriobacteriales bacterium]
MNDRDAQKLIRALVLCVLSLYSAIAFMSLPGDNQIFTREPRYTWDYAEFQGVMHYGERFDLVAMATPELSFSTSPSLDVFMGSYNQLPPLYTRCELVMEHPPFEQRELGVVYLAPSPYGETQAAIDSLNKRIDEWVTEHNNNTADVAEDADIEGLPLAAESAAEDDRETAALIEKLGYPLTVEDIIYNRDDIKILRWRLGWSR